MDKILAFYGLEESKCTIKAFGTGLINQTWKVDNGDSSYILQKVNNHVFSNPNDIAWNLHLIDDFITAQQNDYFFVAPLKTLKGETIVPFGQDGYYRMFPFVQGSHSFDVIKDGHQAYEAARQFGKFTKVLSGMAIDQLKITLPNFHDLSLRYQQFEESLANGNPQRIQAAAELITLLKSQVDIVEAFEHIKEHPDFKCRVTHHDTKISNVLFNDQNRGICVIDLDTVMPGYFISDVGDMMRTYLCPVSEEEQDFSKIEIRDDVYQAIAAGYLKEMGAELTSAEKAHFYYSGLFMIYMQALRFLTDHLNDDAYYGAKYEGHNLVRAQNQTILLQKLLEKRQQLEQV